MVGRGDRSGNCRRCCRVEGLVVESSGSTPHYSSGHLRQSSAALKSRTRGHDSIPVRSPRNSASQTHRLVANVVLNPVQTIV